ncbi:MAG: hypothetical protein K5787_02760 [Lentisphaeria bacterium]|nr:hypothetical protein [Lentisphaeria bacterium]
MKYDLYLPAKAEKDKPVGAMLFIHGGGWRTGWESDMSFACKRFAKEGYVTATMQYSLIDKEKHPRFADMLDDIGKCWNT